MNDETRKEGNAHPWMTLSQVLQQDRQKVCKKNRCRPEFGWVDFSIEEGRMKMEMKI